MTRTLAPLALATLTLLVGGCYGQVHRMITIESEPEGARVWLNDNEIGRTPVTVPFTWYGTYAVRLEHPGYEPLVAEAKVNAPPYQWVPADLAFETVVPGQRYDTHQFTFTMAERRPADPEALLHRAEGFRADAIAAP